MYVDLGRTPDGVDVDADAGVSAFGDVFDAVASLLRQPEDGVDADADVDADVEVDAEVPAFVGVVDAVESLCQP